MTRFATITQTRPGFLLRRSKASKKSSSDGPCSSFHRIKSRAGFHTGGYIRTGRVGKVNRRTTTTGAGVPPLIARAEIPPLTSGAGIPPFTAGAGITPPVQWTRPRHCLRLQSRANDTHRNGGSDCGGS